jgi:hypothetical protein
LFKVHQHTGTPTHPHTPTRLTPAPSRPRALAPCARAPSHLRLGIILIEAARYQITLAHALGDGVFVHIPFRVIIIVELLAYVLILLVMHAHPRREVVALGFIVAIFPHVLLADVGILLLVFKHALPEALLCIFVCLAAALLPVWGSVTREIGRERWRCATQMMVCFQGSRAAAEGSRALLQRIRAVRLQLEPIGCLEVEQRPRAGRAKLQQLACDRKMWSFSTPAVCRIFKTPLLTGTPGANSHVHSSRAESSSRSISAAA